MLDDEENQMLIALIVLIFKSGEVNTLQLAYYVIMHVTISG
jgi:hypothetical protein